MKRWYEKRWFFQAVIAIAATSLSFFLHLSGRLHLTENRTIDLRIVFGRTAPRSPDLFFLAIDNSSMVLDQMAPEDIAASPALTLMKQGWPWSREVHAMAAERLIKAGARVVIFDLLFQTPKDSDHVFRSVIQKYGDRIVIGSNFVGGDQAHGEGMTLTMPSQSLLPAEEEPPPPPRKKNNRKHEAKPEPVAPKARDISELVGYVNFWPDGDDIIRSARFQVTAEQVSDWPDSKRILSLTHVALRKIGLEHMVPDVLEEVPFRYAGAARRAFPPNSIFEIFDQRAWENNYGSGAFFKDKVVLIGPEGNFHQDEQLTPYGRMPGPEVHLNALNAVLQQDFLRTSTPREGIVLIILGGFLSFLLCSYIPSLVRRIILLIGINIVCMALLMIAYNRIGLLILAVAPLGTLNVSCLVSFLYEFALERIEKSRVRSTLEKYVSKNVVRELLDNSQKFSSSLGGVRKPATILFSDIRGFTTMTEVVDSHDLVAQLNEYLTAMVECVFRHNGTLDKFIGDAVMAVWGNAHSDGAEADAVQAVRTARDMHTALQKLNRKWADEGKVPLAIGIGLNHGEVIVGNMGSPQRMEFTVIGDAVNLASRLESLTKEFGLGLLLGESVAALVKNHFRLQTIGFVQVKGKTKPVTVHNVIAESSVTLSEEDTLFYNRYEHGIVCYRRKEFTEGADWFTKALLIKPGNTLAVRYLDQCRTLEENPPPADWDGVMVMTKK